MFRTRSWLVSTTLVIALACGSDAVTNPDPGNGNGGGNGGGNGVGPVASVRFTPAERGVTVWDSIALAPTVTDRNGNVITGRPVTWSSTDVSVATVTTSGWVKGVRGGQTTITATVDGKQGNAVVNVFNPPVAEVTLDAADVALEETATRTLVATPRDAEGRPIPGLAKSWHSTAPDIAFVDGLGTITALRPGSARVRVTVHGKTAEATVFVTANHPYDLVYQSFDGATSSLWQLDLRDADGVPVRLVPSMDGANPAVSRDGQRIAFVSGGDDPSVWIANRDGSGARALVVGSRWLPVYQPAWSPDGAKLAYTRRLPTGLEEILIVDVATGLTLATTEAHPGRQSWPSWSPVKIDGSYRIAYAQGSGALQQIWTMREDATDARAVTTATDIHDAQPAWSPDGQTIAFQRVTVSGSDIWLVDVDGQHPRGLVGIFLAGSQSAPAWSPDGQMIAFSSAHETYGQESSISQIYTVRVNATGLVRRTSGPGDKQLPAWIPRAP